MGLFLMIPNYSCFLLDCKSRDLVGSSFSPIKGYRYYNFFSENSFKEVVVKIDSALLKKPHLNPVDNRYQLLSSMRSNRYVYEGEIDYIFPYSNRSNMWLILSIYDNDPHAAYLRLNLLKSKTNNIKVSVSEWDSLKMVMKKSEGDQILYNVVNIEPDSVRLTYRNTEFYAFCDLTEKERIDVINTFEKNIIPYLNLDLEPTEL